MGINTLTPRYLNLDNDSRIIAAQEMVDALNIRVSADEGGDQGVIKNIKGNVSRGTLGNTSLSATNKIIGCYEHEGTNRFFVFIHNSLGNHTIYELEQSDNSFTKIIESGNISFSGEPLSIDGMMIGDKLHLYFTDGVEEPQKVNVDTDLQVGTYPSSITESAVMKVLPTAPTVEYSTDSARNTNELLGKSFQFAFRYVFRDGEVSAIGEYSDNTVAANTLNDLFEDQDYNSEFNKITIGITPPLGLGLGTTIPNIRVFFRDVYDNTMFYVGEYTYLELSNGLDFYNDESYSVVSDAEFNKTQDAVPKTAQAQTISANRLFYGNYTEGFDKETISATLATNFGLEFSEYSLPETANANTLDNTVVLNTDNVADYINGVDDMEFVIDFAVDKYRWTESALKTIDIKNLAGTSTLETTPSGNVNFEIPKTRYYKGGSVSAPTSQSDYCTKLAAAINGLEVTKTLTSVVVDQYSGSPYPIWTINWSGSVTQKLVATATSTTVELNAVVTDYSVYSTDIEKDSGSGSTAYTGSAAASESNTNGISGSVTMFSVHRQGSFAFLPQTERTFKAGESHSFGIILEDQFGRTSGVYELGSIAIPTLGERNVGERGVAHIDITPSATIANTEFTQYFFVYSGGNTIENYVQYSVAESLLVNAAQTVDTDVSDSDNKIYLPLRTLQGKSNSYNANNDLEYSFSEGDRLRVISYVEDGERVYPQGMEWDISSVYTQDTAGVFGSINTNVATGDFLVIENNEDYDGFAITDIQGSTNLWESDVVVEIYTPKKANTTKIYKAIEGKYAIADINTLRTITQGNAWNKRRNLKFRTGSGSGLSNDVVYVESKQYSDSDALTKGFLGGKPYAVIQSEKEQKRISSITYSEPQLADSAQNNLSSFNNSLANFADYEMNYGGIYGLVDMSDSVMMLQSDKVSRIPISRQILATGTGSEFVTQSTDVLGLQQHYKGNFGINEDRTAFLKADGTVYLVDVTRSKMVALSEQGVKVLSDMNISSWLEERCDSMLADTDGYFVSIGYDKKNNEVVFSLQNEDIDNSEYSIIFSTGLDKFTTFVSYTSPFYGNLGNRFFHIRDNQVWEAEQNVGYAKFFTVRTNPYIKAVFNQNPTSRKVYDSVGVDCTFKPLTTIETIDQSVTIPKSASEEKEGVWYARVPRAEGTSNYIMLGLVEDVSGTTVTMRNKINRLPFKLGGVVSIKDSNGDMVDSTSVISSLDSANSFTATNPSNIADDYVIAIKGDSVDGDPIRGAYAEAKFEFDTASAFELFSVSAHTAESSLHNSQQ